MASKRSKGLNILNASEIGRLGGRARVDKMSKKQLSESGTHAALARWKKTKKV